MLLKEFFHNANWLAIGVAAIVYFAIGSLWFSVLFGKQWMAGHNIQMPTDDEAKARMRKQMPMLMIKTFLMNVLMALAVGIVLKALPQASINCVMGIKVGLLLGGVATIPMVMGHMYTMKSVKLWIIDAGYHILSITLMSIIIAVWHK
ncbi:MAG TPA: DUF1761 domain-containing protein [Bacteroidia bacterium]|nr:DUF1761 domain-containing protein [Bacteroidia bacterium]